MCYIFLIEVVIIGKNKTTKGKKYTYMITDVYTGD